MEHKNLAWPSTFWIALQKELNKPNVQDGLYELQFLFRALIKKKSNCVVLGKNGEGVWSEINKKDQTTWNLVMSFWGWGEKKVFPLSEEVEASVLHASIRLFSLHPDGSIPKVMTAGAKRRRRWLRMQLRSRKDHPHWTKLNLSKNSAKERYEALNNMSMEDRNKMGIDIKQWYFAYQELEWKTKTAKRIHAWLLRKGTIPITPASAWLSIWVSSLDVK